jgi:hypothetical protein
MATLQIPQRSITIVLGLKEVVVARNSAISDFTPNMVDDRPVTMVVAGVSSYSEKDGFRINQDESFEAYNNKLSQVRMLCKDSELVVNDGELTIAFHRTLRLPEDGGKVYKLPTTFGPLPLYSINSVTSRLLKSQNKNLISIAKKGGVFLPLYQREATLISFRSSRPYAIRVFVGGVNAISGRPWNAPSKNSGGEQDYVTVPSQEWLDGIAVDRGTVRQFVAMPLGAGYSVEKQVTGKEELGGFQLEIIPSGERIRLSSRDMISRGATATYTPRQTDMKRGECLVVHGVDRQPLGVRLLRAFYELECRTSHVQQRWQSGASIQMTAIYRFDLTLQFYNSDGASTERVEVRCFPWNSIHELRKSATDENIVWNDYTARFNVFYEDKNVDTQKSTCISDLGIENHSIIRVCERKLLPRPPAHSPWEVADAYDRPTYGYGPQPSTKFSQSGSAMMQTSNPDVTMSAASAAPRPPTYSRPIPPQVFSIPEPSTYSPPLPQRGPSAPQAYSIPEPSTYSRPVPPQAFSIPKPSTYSPPLPQRRPASQAYSIPEPSSYSPSLPLQAPSAPPAYFNQQSADSSTYSRIPVPQENLRQNPDQQSLRPE